MQLSEKHCVPCEGGTAALTPNEVAAFFTHLKTQWENLDNKKIKKEFKLKDFKEAMVFVNKVADIAESEGHHPDITIHYNRVIIELWTHAVKGLSENDFILARKIEMSYNE